MNSTRITIRIPDVCERDIDLLLLEEFIASAEYRSWFLSQVAIDSGAALFEACRSVKTESGESDLEFTFKDDTGFVKVLVENKVDAAFQPDQVHRYMQRANKYEKSGKYREVITVLIAPEIYFGSEAENYGFDAKITYESVLGWLSAAERMNPRTEYKLALLRTAIDRGRSGWQLVPNAHVGRFWQLYWQLAEKVAPQLSMPKPKEKIPAGSHFIVFRPNVLPGNVKLKHKVGYGHVDLEFRGMGDHLGEMEQLYRHLLPPGMRIEPAAKSAVVRALVEPVDMTHTDFTQAEPIMRKAIDAAALLLEWFNTVANRDRGSAI